MEFSAPFPGEVVLAIDERAVRSIPGGREAEQIRLGWRVDAGEAYGARRARVRRFARG